MATWLSTLICVTALVAADPLPSVSPSEAGFSVPKLEAIDGAMQKYIDDQKLAGLVTLIARNGKVARVGIYGESDIEAHKPMKRDAIFRIYSMTKPITTTGLMMLQEQGKFKLDDPVSQYLPAFGEVKVFTGKDKDVIKLADLERPITIRDLMRHTAGLGYGLFPLSPVEVMYRDAKLMDKDKNLDQMIEKLVTLPLAAQPGKRWIYSVAVNVQGKLIEKLSGMPLDEYFRVKIFEPLKMVDSGFFVPEKSLDRFATNYGPKTGGGLMAIDSPKTSDFSKKQKFFSGGGGLCSTADDYLRFAQMLLNKGELDGARILKPATVEEMTKNHLDPSLVPITLGPIQMKGTGFGLGVAVKVAVEGDEPKGAIGEYGWGGAASTRFFVAPKENLICVTMTQYMPVTRDYFEDFRVRVYGAIED